MMSVKSRMQRVEGIARKCVSGEISMQTAVARFKDVFIPEIVRDIAKRIKKEDISAWQETLVTARTNNRGVVFGTRKKTVWKIDAIAVEYIQGASSRQKTSEPDGFERAGIF